MDALNKQIICEMNAVYDAEEEVSDQQF